MPLASLRLTPLLRKVRLLWFHERVGWRMQVINSFLLSFLQQVRRVFFRHDNVPEGNVMYNNCPCQQDSHISRNWTRMWDMVMRELTLSPVPAKYDTKCKMIGTVYRRKTFVTFMTVKCEITRLRCRQSGVYFILTWLFEHPYCVMCISFDFSCPYTTTMITTFTSIFITINLLMCYFFPGSIFFASV